MSLPRISTWASASPRDRKDVTVHPGFSASYLALWGLVIFQSLVVLALLRELAELHTVTERHALAREVWLPLGTEAPQFTAADRRSGRPVSTQELSGTGGVILFLSTGCSACETLVASLKRAVAGDSFPAFPQRSWWMDRERSAVMGIPRAPWISRHSWRRA